MAILNQAKYLAFDHVYAETVVVSDLARIENGVAAHRFVLRTGAYPAAGGYAAGVSIYDIYGVSALTGYPQRTLTGTVTIAETTGVVTGSGTAFLTEIAVGTHVQVGDVKYVVTEVTSNTAAVVAVLGGGSVEAVAGGATMVRLEAIGGYNVEPPAGLSLDYQDRMSPSTTPLAPRVFPYQKNLTVVTNGIAIVEVAPSQTFAVDGGVWADANGRALSATTGAGVMLGRSLDALTTGALDTGFIRVKLGAGTN